MAGKTKMRATEAVHTQRACQILTIEHFVLLSKFKMRILLLLYDYTD